MGLKSRSAVSCQHRYRHGWGRQRPASIQKNSGRPQGLLGPSASGWGWGRL